MTNSSSVWAWRATSGLAVALSLLLASQAAAQDPSPPQDPQEDSQEGEGARPDVDSEQGDADKKDADKKDAQGEEQEEASPLTTPKKTPEDKIKTPPKGPIRLPKQTPRPKRGLPPALMQQPIQQPPQPVAPHAPHAPGHADPELEIQLGAEYRVRTIQITPLDLSGEQVTDTHWTEQRLRLQMDAGYKGLVQLHTTVDALNGVLFGDNGVFNQDPSSTSGVGLAAKRPNVVRWGVGLRDGFENPLNSDEYVPRLIKAEPLEFVHAYADVLLPIGLLRVGRQPQAYGSQLASHEGARINRWGVSTQPDVTDRALFGTKLDQAFYVLRDGPSHKLDLRQDNGVFLAVFHDWLVQDSVLGTGDDTTQTGGALQYRRKQADWLGLDWRELFVGLSVVHLANDLYNSDAWGVPFKVYGEVDDFALELQSMVIRGSSREISEGFAALRSREGSQQDIRSLGLRGVLDYRLGPVTFTLEGDYASGDADPRPETPITMFSFARSFNIGLLMFEHILAFESARSVAVGIENLRQQNAASFPLTEVSTEGRFTNAAAFFPQLKVDWLDTGKHKLHTRFGALMAWPADDGVVDAISTILAEDGERIDDDAVNFHGGKPGGYYGTELDLQIEWSIQGHFFWTVEGALLLPGSSLQDENGDAAPAYLIENRLTYVF